MIRIYIQDIDLKLKDWAFDQRKNLPYELKLALTEKRIREWYEYWGGDVYVSFSGGLDSTVNKKDKDKYSWEANPYVWVIEFKVIYRDEALNLEVNNDEKNS